MMSPASPDLLLDVGDRLPDETMQDERGRSVSLYRQTLAGRPVILYLSDDLADADAKKHITDFQKILLPIRQFDAFVFAVGRGTSADHAPLIQELGLQYLLLSDPEQFPRTVTEKLMAYALGRRLESYDQPAVRKIVRAAAAQQYRWSAIVRGIAESPAFLMRAAN